MPRRRHVLATLIGTVPLAGCSALGSGRTSPTSTPERYVHLREKQVSVAASLGHELPDSLTAAESPDSADVVVLPASTDRTAEEVVAWLVGDARVALVGHGSEERWHEWRNSDAYAHAFGDPRGRAEARAGGGEPPELVVAWVGDDESTTTDRTTWGHTDDPSTEALFTAIEESFE